MFCTVFCTAHIVHAHRAVHVLLQQRDKIVFCHHLRKQISHSQLYNSAVKVSCKQCLSYTLSVEPFTSCKPYDSEWPPYNGHCQANLCHYYCQISYQALFSICLRCAGYLFQKVGKVAATAVGGGLLLLQVLLHRPA